MTSADAAGRIEGPPSDAWQEAFLDDAFCNLVGPIYVTEHGESHEPIRLGMRIESRHCNKIGICHGGMLMAFLDNSLGYVATRYLGNVTGGPTISVTANFLRPARNGDWIESRVRIERSTRKMQFVSGGIVVGDEPIVQGSGIFVRPASPDAG